MSVISHDLNFIYIRVPRTGSTTFLHHLESAVDTKQVGGQHESAIEARFTWHHRWDSSLTFGFIRNPWDWLVSVYNANLSTTAGEPELHPGALIEPHDAPGIHPGQRMNATFDEWVRQRKTFPADWLYDGDERIVKQVWLFEDLIQRTSVIKSDMPHSPYQEWYTPELVDFVAEKCKREIEVGKYEF